MFGDRVIRAKDKKQGVEGQFGRHSIEDYVEYAAERVRYFLFEKEIYIYMST